VIGPVIAVVGPSGVGKDSVMAALAAADPGLKIMRRVITRQHDAGGEEFSPVSPAEFDRIATAGGFALSWEAHGLKYGIPCTLDELRRGARGVLVNLSRGVLVEAQRRFAPLIVLSLSASRAVLADRLNTRGRESGSDRADRLARADFPLPGGLHRVHHIDNSAALDQTVQAALAALYPERV